MAVTPVNPLYGGQESLTYGVETTPGTLATTLTSNWYVDIPGISENATYDDIYPLGTYLRDTSILQDYAPSISISQKLQDIVFIGSAIRNATTKVLPSYSFLFGDSTQATVVLGAKCESLEINIPRQGEVTAAANFQALAVQPTAAVPAAMTYLTQVVNTVTVPVNVFQGYDLKFSQNPGASSTDQTALIKNIRISIKHDLVRGPAAVTGAGPYFLQSSFLKETKQMVSVSFDLYEPIPAIYVSQLCQSLQSFEALLSDYCVTTHLIRISLPKLIFNQQALQAAGGQDLLSFTMAATAADMTLANV